MTCRTSSREVCRPSTVFWNAAIRSSSRCCRSATVRSPRVRSSVPRTMSALRRSPLVTASGKSMEPRTVYISSITPSSSSLAAEVAAAQGVEDVPPQLARDIAEAAQVGRWTDAELVGARRRGALNDRQHHAGLDVLFLRVLDVAPVVDGGLTLAQRGDLPGGSGDLLEELAGPVEVAAMRGPDRVGRAADHLARQPQSPLSGAVGLGEPPLREICDLGEMRADVLWVVFQATAPG